ncbi:MAG: tetratricopeptide repeat protein [Planctomycetaceae bacterium]
MRRRHERLTIANAMIARWIAAWLCVLGNAAAVSAAPQDPQPGPTGLRGSLRLQEADDEVQPLRPIVPRSVTTERKLEAISWFMTGRLLEIRNEKQKAYEAYIKAVELDPQAAEIYRLLVPLAFQLDEVDDAVKYATKGVELMPEDYQLLRQLGVYLAQQRKIPEAIGYLSRAASSPEIEKDSPAYVLLMRELGILYAATGQTAQAADAYTIVFAALQDPEKYGLDFRTKARLLADMHTTYERIGQVLLEGKRLDLARQAFEQAAVTGRAGAGNLAYYQAKVLLMSDQPEEALTELQKYFDAQRQSKGRDAYLLLGEVLEKLQRRDEFIGRLQQLAENDSRNTVLQYFLAEQLIAAGELDQAKTIYEAALEGTSDAAGYLGLATVYRKMKRPGELLDALGRSLSRAGPEALEGVEVELKAISADEELLKALLEAGRAQQQSDPPEITFEKSYLLAKLAAERELIDDAAEFYRVAMKLDKDRLSIIYSELGELYLKAHRYKDATTVYAEASKERSLADRRPDFLFRLAYVQEMSGETAAALESIDEALKLVPDNPTLRVRECWIYSHSKQFDKAIAGFEKVMADFPNQKEIVRVCQFSLSNIYVQKGEQRKGEEILERVLEEEPDDPSVNNDLGYLYADQGKNLDQAEKMIRKAIAADPDNAAYQDSLGWVLFKLGRFEEARTPLEKACSLSTGTGDGTLWDHLGDVYHRLNLLDKAVEAWEKALSITEQEAGADPQLKQRLVDKLKQYKK